MSNSNPKPSTKFNPRYIVTDKNEDYLTELLEYPSEELFDDKVGSFEVSIESIRKSFPDLEKNIREIKEKCVDPKDGLTADELAAIQLFTVPSNNSKPLWECLNGIIPMEKSKPFNLHLPFIRLLIKSLTKINSESAKVFHIVQGKLYDKESIKTNFTWRKFTFCTSDFEPSNVSKHSTDKVKTTIFQISCDNLIPLQNYSYDGIQGEFLILPNAKFSFFNQFNLDPNTVLIQLTAENYAVPKSKQDTPKSESNFSEDLSSKNSSKPQITIKKDLIKSEIVKRGLKSPTAIAFDPIGKRIYIAERKDSQIICWKLGNEKNETSDPPEVLSIKNLGRPKALAIDSKRNILLISDSQNKTVVKIDLTGKFPESQIVIHRIDCQGLTVDSDGMLYVIDDENKQIRKYLPSKQNNSTEYEPTSNPLKTGANPYSIAVNKEGTIYLTDLGENTITEWKKNDEEGTNFADENHELSNPRGIVVDQDGTIYVCNDGQDRSVIKLGKDGKSTTFIALEQNPISDDHELGHPTGLALDHDGYLYLTDNTKNNVRRFLLKRSS